MAQVLTFDPEKHEYRINGVLVPSVSQILAPLYDFSKIPRDVLERKRQIGTAIHKAIELDLLGDLDVALGQLGDVDQALDAVAHPDEGAEGDKLGDLARDDLTDRVGPGEVLPRILLRRLERQRHSLAVHVDVDDLDGDLLTNLHGVEGSTKFRDNVNKSWELQVFLAVEFLDGLSFCNAVIE